MNSRQCLPRFCLTVYGKNASMIVIKSRTCLPLPGLMTKLDLKLNETYLEVEFWHSWYTPDFKFAQQGKLTGVGL